MNIATIDYYDDAVELEVKLHNTISAIWSAEHSQFWAAFDANQCAGAGEKKAEVEEIKLLIATAREAATAAERKAQEIRYSARKYIIGR